MTREEELAAIRRAIETGRMKTLPPATDSALLDRTLARLRAARIAARHPLGRNAKHRTKPT